MGMVAHQNLGVDLGVLVFHGGNILRVVQGNQFPHDVRNIWKVATADQRQLFLPANDNYFCLCSSFP